MSCTSSPPHRMTTRAGNKQAHPGNVLKAAPRRTTADVQWDKTAKAQAKKAHQEARQQNINDLAEFEHADMVNEGVDATPRPLALSTPKPLPPLRDHTRLSRCRIADSSDGEAFNNPVSTLSCTEKSTTEDDSSSESVDEDSDDPPSAKRRKAQTTQKATAAAGEKAVGKEPTGKKNKTDHRVVPASTDKQPRAPKKRKVKAVVKVRDEIKVAGEKIREGREREVTPANADLLMDSTGNSDISRKKRKQASPIENDSSANRGVVLTKIVQVGHHGSGPSLHPVNTKSPTLSLCDEGGLSDNDEMRGSEREAAINSPVKGTSRVTSEQLVVQKSSTASSTDNKTVSKKPRNDGLPAQVNNDWFRRTFVTTYMAFVGQTNDPWEVPVRQSVQVMQKIWDATGGIEYEITSKTAIYQKTVQRLTDSWRSSIGSAGIAALMAFFDSHQDFRDSDEERMKFAKNHLNSLRFLYKDSGHDDKKKWKGLFRSPLVLQTFAAHLTAIKGSVRVSGLHDHQSTPAAVGGLGLAAASVERALTLVSTGVLTFTIARASNGKTIKFPKTRDLSSGKCSTHKTDFSEATWGKDTRAYATSARSLTKVKFEAIIQDAQQFVKLARSRKKRSAEAMDVDGDCNERACLVDNSDLGSDSGSGTDVDADGDSE
ncbi:hypothetical protein EDB86DRAFT_3087613 [Lactarius hatsudake]|nr:hypothetical protein EDB86DRAFT_3087613 [Lactarius hatsudake]